MWGIPWDKPVRRLNEYLDGLLPLLAGEPANAAGETVTTRGALVIPGAPRPDVYIAALGPQMLRLAGRRTSGTCTWMTGPDDAWRSRQPDAAPGGRRRRAPRRSVRVVAALPVAVTDDVDGGAQAGRRAVRRLRDATARCSTARSPDRGRASSRGSVRDASMSWCRGVDDRRWPDSPERRDAGARRD